MKEQEINIRVCDYNKKVNQRERELTKKEWPSYRDFDNDKREQPVRLLMMMMMNRVFIESSLFFFFSFVALRKGAYRIYYVLDCNELFFFFVLFCFPTVL